jgi:hypothetical protein
MARRVRIAVVSAAVLTAVGLPMLPASAAGASSITGVAFEDANRNGVRDTAEPVRSGETLWLKDATGTAIAAATTASDGTYRFDGVPSGDYSITYSSTSWWNTRADWVPTTSPADARPVRTLTAPTSASVDFGWRRIVRSVPPAAPLTRYVGPEGLVVESYDDVVDAAALYRAVTAGSHGAEAPYVRVLFDASGSSTTSSSASNVNGRWSDYSSSVYVAWTSWLDEGDRVLSHEYGHAWSLYYAYIVQQDPSLAGYLSARGLSGDPRLGSSYEWSPREMIAEDYRQLLGSATAAAAPQANADIPAAASVPGLASYLRSTFTGAASAGASSSPSPSPTASPSPSASPSPAPATSPTPTPTATSSAVPTASPSPAKASKGGCGKRC